MQNYIQSTNHNDKSRYCQIITKTNQCCEFLNSCHMSRYGCPRAPSQQDQRPVPAGVFDLSDFPQRGRDHLVEVMIDQRPAGHLAPRCRHVDDDHLSEATQLVVPEPHPAAV